LTKDEIDGPLRNATCAIGNFIIIMNERKKKKKKKKKKRDSLSFLSSLIISYFYDVFFDQV
jgi:hypothetical protein